ncbi:hypothetical protein [Deinococcus radiophilus]|uniref:hypothetical protein n=1 Tax=Deinococcus radiophilus TaxID=32062 RepID=UPI00361D089F
MSELLDTVLLLGLFVAALRLMLFPAERLLRYLTLLVLAGLAALLVTLNWEANPQAAPGRVQGLLVLAAALLPALLGVHLPRRWVDWGDGGASGPVDWTRHQLSCPAQGRAAAPGFRACG